MSVTGNSTDGHRIKVAVLMGGASSEREVSLVSGRMVVAALDPNRYDVEALDTRDLVRLTGGSAAVLPPAPDASMDNLPAVVSGADGLVPNSPAALSGAPARPDVVFIALHGKGGEDGAVQGMLEVLGLPYTGSGVLASALAMDKVMSKRLFRGAGIPVIEGIFVTRAAMNGCDAGDFASAALREVESRIGFPVFVKPNAGGSTCGCALVTRPNQLATAVREALTFDDVALIEKYVKGTEITVGVLDFAGQGQKALPVIEIVPKSEFYDYESKYAEGGSEHIIPARLPDHILRRAQEIARECHALLGCRGVSRTDIIVSDDRLYVLEVNTIPGMTPTSLLPQAALLAGIPFPELLDGLIRSALDVNQG